MLRLIRPPSFGGTTGFKALVTLRQNVGIAWSHTFLIFPLFEGEIQNHLQCMLDLLRPEDELKVVSVLRLVTFQCIMIGYVLIYCSIVDVLQCSMQLCD